jgi:hypothetical protein
MDNIPQNRLVRKEVALGTIRALEPPTNHMVTNLLAPMYSVESDDVIFDYAPGLATGLAPARAEDAESELAQKDESVGHGRASVIDWALKDHYDPSDVSRYRESLYIGGLSGAGNLPLTVNSLREGFEAKMARNTRQRRRKLDNRIEWLGTQALEHGQIVYNDGKIKFTVPYGRPAGQTTDVVDTLWSDPNSDPIGDLLERIEAANDLYGVTLNRAVCSQKVINKLMTSEKFTNTLIGNNPLYTVQGWGVDAARNIVQNQSGVTFITYDSVYRTKAYGTNNIVNNRFLSDDKIYLLPSDESINEIDDMIGFGKTLTSPHPEGNWTSGFYEWEKDTGPDPWGYDMGTGVKAFPVFPHLELTWVTKVI